MSKKLHHVSLTDPAREELQGYLRKGVHSARMLNRVRVLLLADAGRPDKAIAAQVGLSRATVYNIRRRFAAGGLDASLREKREPDFPRGAPV